MKLPVILQSRMGSTRLPGKALRELGGRPLTVRVLEALLAARRVAHVVVAVPANSEAALRPLVEALGCRLFVGSEEDVLGRFAGALEGETAAHCIRATGDNPLVCPELLDGIVEHHLASGADLSHYIGNALGTGVEVVRTAALLEAAGEAVDPFEREHVTPFLYRHPERYRIEEPRLELGGELRLTVDTEEDFRRVEAIWRALYRGRPLPLREILATLEQKPDLLD